VAPDGHASPRAGRVSFVLLLLLLWWFGRGGGGGGGGVVGRVLVETPRLEVLFSVYFV
jgi:hypothetical protein